MLHDAESELCQKLLTTDNIPGTHWTNIISETIYAGTQKKYLLKPMLNGESIYIYTVNGNFDN